jgi:hypothetical protein
MQYILTEEEMEQVRKLREEQKYLPNPEYLQKMCSYIADNWPSWRGWDGKSEPEPWGCILTQEYEHYCDKCPVINICPYKHKEWSK